MLRKFIFKDSKTQQELALPVTPESFTIRHGVKVETVDMYTLGDLNLAGGGALATLSIQCLFPGKSYPFTTGTAQTPYAYVQFFEQCADNHTPLRFVVSDTPVNMEVLVESIEYGERDGTNDVYATLSLREYRLPKIVKTEQAAKTEERRVETPPAAAKTYTVKTGDTLSAICREFYGDGSKALYTKIASYNGIKNPNLIYAGKTLQLPDKSKL